MKLNYYFHSTPSLQKSEQRLSVLSETTKLLPNLSIFAVNWRRQSLLKSSLFSARIEGNNLQPQNLTEVFPRLSPRPNRKLLTYIEPCAGFIPVIVPSDYLKI